MAAVEPKRLAEFTKGYLVCLLWAETDDNGNPLDANYDESDIAPDTMERIKADCEAFYNAWQADINAETCLKWDHTPESRAGHDFWLTRNGHGAGFWDGDWNEREGKLLTDASKIFGEFAIYIGDDGKIHH